MKTRIYVAGTLAGLAALAITAVVVFAYGRHDPSPPSLLDEPNPAIAGQILYINRDSCFVRAQASGGGEEQLGCMPKFFFPGGLYWIDEETAGAVLYGPDGPMLHEIDIRTGQVSEGGRAISLTGKPGFPQPFGGVTAPDGTSAFFDEDGKLILLVEGKQTQVAEFDVPQYGQPQVILWSPDSQWLLAQYYPRHADGPELWVISRDGQISGTLTEDAWQGQAVAWRIEGVGAEPALP